MVGKPFALTLRGSPGFQMPRVIGLHFLSFGAHNLPDWFTERMHVQIGHGVGPAVHNKTPVAIAADFVGNRNS
jgi:hypothetical protein